MPSSRKSPADRAQHDVVVVGSGPGGSVTACLLAEAGRNVLLVEEGPMLPLESCHPFTRDEMVQKYRNGGVTAAIGNPKVTYVEACCVGGGSEVNSGLYHRLPPEIFDEWRNDYRVASFTEQDLLLHFETVEKDIHVGLSPGPLPLASLKLREGADRLGWKAVEVPRWFKYESLAGSDSASGVRQSMTKTYIPRFLAAGGKIQPQTRVEHLRYSTGGWRLICRHSSSDGAPRSRRNKGGHGVCLWRRRPDSGTAAAEQDYSQRG